MCEHPVLDVELGGEAVHPLCDVFHLFLQSVADVMMYLNPGSPLQVTVHYIHQSRYDFDCAVTMMCECSNIFLSLICFTTGSYKITTMQSWDPILLLANGGSMLVPEVQGF